MSAVLHMATGMLCPVAIRANHPEMTLQSETSPNHHRMLLEPFSVLLGGGGNVFRLCVPLNTLLIGGTYQN